MHMHGTGVVPNLTALFFCPMHAAYTISCVRILSTAVHRYTHTPQRSSRTTHQQTTVWDRAEKCAGCAAPLAYTATVTARQDTYWAASSFGGSAGMALSSCLNAHSLPMSSALNWFAGSHTPQRTCSSHTSAGLRRMQCASPRCCRSAGWV